ncbi:MAG: hypothetical protein ACE5IY_19635 [bacterium]
MKKLTAILLALVAIAAVIYLSKIGVLPGWQFITMIAAAVAAPFKLLLNVLGDKEAQIRKKHEQIRQQESEYQSLLDQSIEQRKQNILRLNMEIDKLDSKIDALKKKSELIDEEVEQMGLEQLQSEGRRLFG